MMFARVTALVFGLALFDATGAAAQAAAPPSKVEASKVEAPKVDWADPASWLCRPGRPADACGRSDQDATVLQADGSAQLERFHADPNAPIDCFYVYPTVSTDPGANAPMKVERAEVAVINQQFARFASVCRPYAPLYRQVTLASLHAAMRGQPMPTDRELPYQVVKAAWDYYLAHDNRGRGVVLIGHSQGSLVLAQLVKQEIDGKPVQGRVVSVILAGYPLQVLAGRDVGGDFKAIPLCRAPGQTGCAISFSSYRADSPPPADFKIFGAALAPGLQAACTNPAALAGGPGALRAYLGEGSEMVTASGDPQGPWTNPPKPIATPFVEVPGLLSAECRTANDHTFLAISLHPTPGGARTNDIVGDLVVGGQRVPSWGLHRVDVNLVMGNLIEVVRAQETAYLAKKR